MPRKKEFNPEMALEKAMYYFWKNGFENTSIRSLISSTGVNFYGLYSALGDKKGIYLKALDKYIELYVEALLSHSNETQDIPSVVKSVFEHIACTLNEKCADAGCMVCNAAVEVAAEDVDVAFRVQRHRQLIEQFWCDLLNQQSNSLDQKKLSQCSEFLCTQLYGMAMLIRSKSDTALINRHIDTSALLVDSLL
ncbi:TetR/AcrR family transcriptional regulator [Aestuariibacter sp. A3R04]|uniref:TetR/AcrR family transcriptional regulator n=1 Tax=Aestuariibacter sp. A3R04 TaxID=2841571 RepID=UPI001C0A6247|nr:TetR/AcrR family transcriptional regulator [Aestuariibacter sp. A3R04]MBU3023456.1 TetR/AcrR family transcriptional regulator [Aestuariibacter sp. A3R04]